MDACRVCGVAHNRDAGHVFQYVDGIDIPGELKDPITFEPLFDAVQLPCGHTFSRYAIVQSLSIKDECPLGKEIATMDSLRPVPIILRSLLDKLKVYCPNSTTESNCGEIERGNLPDHLKHCENSFVSCSNEANSTRCGVLVRRRDLASHDTVCSLRKKECPNGCGLQVILSASETHNCLAALRDARENLHEALEQAQQQIAALSAKVHELETAPKPPAPQQTRVLMVRIGTIHHDRGALGLRLGLHPSGCVVVHEITPDSPAARCRAISVGDCIVKIDGANVCHMPIEAVALALKGTRNRTTIIQVINIDDFDLYAREVAPLHSTPVDIGIRTVTLHRGPAGLGMSILAKEPFVVTNISPGSVADRSGIIHVGDEIMAVNGRSTAAMPYEAVFAELSARSSVDIMVRSASRRS